MYKFRKITTILALVLGMAFLQGCNREIQAKEAVLLKTLTDEDIEDNIRDQVEAVIEDYSFIDIDGFRVVHDLTEDHEDGRYQLVMDLSIRDTREELGEEVDTLSAAIASNINKGEPIMDREIGRASCRERV